MIGILTVTCTILFLLVAKDWRVPVSYWTHNIASGVICLAACCLILVDNLSHPVSAVILTGVSAFLLALVQDHYLQTATTTIWDDFDREREVWEQIRKFSDDKDTSL